MVARTTSSASLASGKQDKETRRKGDKEQESGGAVPRASSPPLPLSLSPPLLRATAWALMVATALIGTPARAADEVLPKHITPETLKAVRDGLDYLARTQADDGAWHDGQGGAAYPVAVTSLALTSLLAHGDSPTRGRYAPQLERGTEYLIKCKTKTGLITSPSQDSGMPMHGHGFALMYLASVYGMLTKESLRDSAKEAIEAGVELTARGQSGAGGWTYVPASGDEGSVTVTQVQALRAAHNSGFLVPRGTIDEAVRYIERCSTAEGGIQYSLGSGG